MTHAIFHEQLITISPYVSLKYQIKIHNRWPHTT